MAGRHEIPGNAFCLGGVEPRLGEFDLGGVLYHARYFHIYEDAREMLLREIGVPYPDLIAANLHLAVTEAHQRFRSPVRYGVPFDVYIWVEDLRRSAVTVHYSFVGEAEVLLHSAWTKHFAILQQDGRFAATRIPDALRDGFQRYTTPEE